MHGLICRLDGIQQQLYAFLLKSRRIFFPVFRGRQGIIRRCSAWNIFSEQIIQLSYRDKTGVAADAVLVHMRTGDIEDNGLQVNLFQCVWSEKVHIIPNILSRIIQVRNQDNRNLAVVLGKVPTG